MLTGEYLSSCSYLSSFSASPFSPRDDLLPNIIEDIKEEKKEYDKFLLYKKYYERFMKTPDSK